MSSLAARISALPRRFSPAAQAFLLSILITGIVNAAWMLFFNIYILARGFDKDILGLLNAAPSIAALVLGLPLGILSDRMGRRQAMIAGLIAAVAGWTLEVTLLNPTLIFIAALLAGAGSTLWLISQAPYVMDVSDDGNRTLIFSLNYGLSVLAGGVGNLFAGQLPLAFSRLFKIAEDSPGAYQAVLISSLIITAAGILPLVFVREPPVHHIEEPPVRAGMREIFTRPLTLKLNLPNFLLGCGASLIVGYFNVFYVEEWKLSDQNLGVLFSVMSFVVGLGTFVGPRLVAWMGGSKIRTVMALQSAGILCILILGFSPVLWISELGFLLRATVMMIGGALYSAFTMEKTRPEERSTVNSLLQLTWQIGWAVGPYISGLVQVKYGFSPLFIATSVFYASAIFAAWIFFGREP